MSSKFPRPEGPRDTMDRATPEQIAAARVRWGLDVAPPVRMRPADDVPDAVKRRASRIVNAAGTPQDVVRALIDLPIPAEWEREVAEMSPKSESHSYLRLFWREPLFSPDRRRLVLHECVPNHLIGDEHRMFLADKPYWELPREERTGRAKLVSAFQWEMYRREGISVTPFWCLQGSDGGTPMAYADIERRWLRAMKQPDTPPGLGELPFAPWDNRVRRAVERRDRLRTFGGRVSELRKRGNADYLRAESEAMEKEYRREFFRWFSDTMQEQADVWRWYTSHTEVTHRIPQQTRAEWLAAADAEERFIETGTVPDPVQYANR